MIMKSTRLQMGERVSNQSSVMCGCNVVVPSKHMFIPSDVLTQYICFMWVVFHVQSIVPDNISPVRRLKSRSSLQDDQKFLLHLKNERPPFTLLKHKKKDEKGGRRGEGRSFWAPHRWCQLPWFQSSCGWCCCANGRQAAGRLTAADGATQVSKNTQALSLAYMCHIITVIIFLSTHGERTCTCTRTQRHQNQSMGSHGWAFSLLCGSAFTARTLRTKNHHNICYGK